MNRGWAKFSRLTEMKRRPFLQKGKYFWLSIFLGLVPFLLFRIAVFYDVTFPIGAQSYDRSTVGGSNATRLDIGLPALRDRSNVRDDEAAWTKEDKGFVKVIEENGGREFEGFKPDGEEVDSERRSSRFASRDSDGFAVQAVQIAEKDGKGLEDLESELKELAKGGEQEKVGERNERKEEEETRSTLKAEEEEEKREMREEEASELKEEEESRGEEEQIRREEEQRRAEERDRRVEEYERKSEEEALKKRKEEEKDMEEERRLVNEPEPKSEVEKVSGIEVTDKAETQQKQGGDEGGKDTEFEVIEEQSRPASDSNVIVEVVSGTDSKALENGVEEVKEETKPADDHREEAEHSESQEKAQEEEKKVIHIVSPRDEELSKRLGHCNLYDGDWEYDEAGPLYTNATCPHMQADQNCLANGRPDSMYLHWRWKPRQCDLPRFDPAGFLQALKGKSIAFVGDSLARNQMQSLLCMLYQVEQPIWQYDSDYTTKYRFEEHEVNLMTVWAPYLVKFAHTSIEGYDLDNVLYMDGLHLPWTERLDEMDIITISIGQWFFKSSLYVKDNGKEILGCYQCDHLKNVTDIGFRDIFRESMRVGLERILWERNKIVILTTFGVQHYEHGPWDSGWCRREKPITVEEAPGFGWMNEEMRGIVLDELTKVLDSRQQGDNKMFFDFLDITKVNLLRADGHPGPYRRQFPYAFKDPSEWVLNDCLHWCMPGPIDTWNQILHKILERYL